MKCVELKVHFENASTARESIERSAVESLLAALEETLDATIRSFHDRASHDLAFFPGYSEHLHSDLEFTNHGCILVFQFRDAEPVRCRLFEQFATDLIQCAASTYLLAGSGVSMGALLPHLYEDRVLLFWGSFTKHAPPTPLLTRLGLYSSSCRFEKTLEPAEYGAWVANFDRLAGRLVTDGPDHRNARESGAAATPARASRQLQGRGARMAAIATARDEDAFVRALRRIPRETLLEDEYLNLIRLALGVGAYWSARELASDAHAQFPGSVEASRFVKVLGPPELGAPAEGVRTPVDEQEWVKRNASGFEGQWVALRGGDLLASGSSLSAVRDAVGSLSGLFVTRIP